MAVPTVAAVSEHLDTLSATAHSIALPTGTSNGDLLLHLVAFDNGDNPVYPTGFTELYDIATNTGGAGTRMGAAWRIVDGTEADPLTYTSTSTRSADGLLRITGHDGADPIDVTNTTESSASETTGVCPSVTTTNNDALVIRHGGTDFGRTITWATATEDFMLEETAHSGTGAHESQVTAGATGTEDFTWTSSSRWAGATIAINAAPAGGGARGFPLVGPFGGPIGRGMVG